MVSVGETEAKTPIRRRHRSECNIKVDCHEIGLGGDLIFPAQDKYRKRTVVNTVMKLRVL